MNIRSDLRVWAWSSDELIKQSASKADVAYWIKQQIADRMVVALRPYS